MQRKCNVIASTKKKRAPILSNDMNQNNQKKTSKELENEMDFYVPVGAILVELQDTSENPNYTIVMVGSED